MKVELGTLKDKAEELVAFLEPRVGTKPAVSGSAIEIDDEAIRKGVKPRHVKTYIKRFLFINKMRKDYRILVHGRELTVQELELGEKEKEEREKVKAKLEEAERKEKEEREEEPEAKKEEEKEPEVKKAEKAAPEAKKKKEDAPKTEKKPKGEAKKKEKAKS